MAQFKFDEAPTHYVAARDLKVGDVIADYYTTWEVLDVRHDAKLGRVSLNVKPSNPAYESHLNFEESYTNRVFI
jgi:hypothetical protein